MFSIFMEYSILKNYKIFAVFNILGNINILVNSKYLKNNVQWVFFYFCEIFRIQKHSEILLFSNIF